MTRPAKAITYQVERAPFGTKRWEQLFPQVETRPLAETLLDAEKIKADASGEPVRLRIIRTTREVIRETES